MIDPYLLGVARMKEAELRRESELARRGRARTPQHVGKSVSRTRIVLAQWLISAAERLWPEAGRTVTG